MTNVAYINPQQDVTPHNVEAEQIVLGSILTSPDRLAVVMGGGGASLFFDPTHAGLFEKIVEKDRAGLLASPVTLADWANENMADLGGAGYLARMAGASIASSVPDLVTFLGDLSAKRRILDAMATAKQAISIGERTPSDIAGALEASLLDVGGGTSPRPVTMMKAATEALRLSWEAYSGSDAGSVPTGIRSVDHLMGGFYPGELILLGGRPSMGKTAVALSIGLNAARAGKGVAIFSLEMNPEAMAMRAISEATAEGAQPVNYSDIRRGTYSPQQLEQIKAATHRVSELPIMFLSREFSDLGALFSGAKQAKRVLGDELDLLIVDYAQLLKSSARSRYEQITEISMALKALAGQLNIPVLALSQLSRSLEQREDKRPMLSDLRESGQLEQDADAVMFCFREDYYLDREEPDMGDSEARALWLEAKARVQDSLEIIVAKQRQGQIGTARVMCKPALNYIWETAK